MVTNADTDNVSMLLGAGTGSFGAATNFGAGDGAESVAIRSAGYQAAGAE